MRKHTREKIKKRNFLKILLKIRDKLDKIIGIPLAMFVIFWWIFGIIVIIWVLIEIIL